MTLQSKLVFNKSHLNLLSFFFFLWGILFSRVHRLSLLIFVPVKSWKLSMKGSIKIFFQGSYRVLNSWESLEIWPAIFQTWKMSGKWYILSFHSKATTSASEVKSFSFWSNLIQSHPYVCSASQKKLIPESFVFPLLEKSPEKVLNFGHKNLCERCSLQPKFKMFNC